MGTRLKRDQLHTENIPAIAKQAASRRRGGEESRQEAPHTELERVTYSFDLAEVKSIRMQLICQGVVINPPKPKFVIELTVEKFQRRG